MLAIDSIACPALGVGSPGDWQMSKAESLSLSCDRVSSRSSILVPQISLRAPN